jgi:K+-transporting ATPase ATPase C chain
VQDRAARIRAAHGLAADVPVPADLVFASASGLDPHVSPDAARVQAARVARARGRDTRQVLSVVDQFVEPPQWGFLGEERVNVLRLNLAMDQL